jgi:hypothetical protein
MKDNKKNGSDMTQEEKKRLQVVQSELNARYWKSQFEIMDYSIKYEQMLPEYEEHLKRMKVLEEQKFAEFQKVMEDMKAQSDSVEGLTEEKDNDEAPVHSEDTGNKI